MQTSPLMLIGQNSRGQWIAQKQSGRSGGLFTSREAAVKYAMFETGRRAELVVTVPGILELAMGTFPVVTTPYKPEPSRPTNQPAFKQAA